MDTISATIGIPVSDLPLSQLWYEAVFELDVPELEPVEGIVEYRVGDIWLQLSQEEDAAPTPNGMVLRFGVENVWREHARLERLGVDVSPVVHVEGAVDFLDVADPDGNLLSLYTLDS